MIVNVMEIYAKVAETFHLNVDLMMVLDEIQSPKSLRLLVSESVKSLIWNQWNCFCDISDSIKVADQSTDWHCHPGRVVCAAKHFTFQPNSAQCKPRHLHILQMIKTRPWSANTGLCQNGHFSKKKQSWGVPCLHVERCYGLWCM